MSKKVPENWYCKKCDYNTCRKSQFDRHILTAKHKNTDDAGTVPYKKVPKFACECGKTYSHRQSLHTHKKMCNYEEKSEKQQDNVVEELDKTPIQQITNILLDVLKENKECKDLMLEIANKETTHTTINNTMNHTTNHNKFNMNFFLNEKCKDAMNIMDFIASLELGTTDVEEIGELGYVKGISNIILRGLNELDIYKRPVHCSDIKRETLYIKDKNVWEKENVKNEKLKLAIKHVAHKNVKQITEWQRKHPDYNEYESKENEKYLKIVSEAMGGTTQDDDELNYNKIIKNVAKEVFIQKV
jgi:hypothetical protein